MGTKGYERRKERREKRRGTYQEKSQAWKNLGGTKAESDRLRKEATDQRAESRTRANSAYDDVKTKYDDTNKAERAESRQYSVDRSAALGRSNDAYGAIDNIGKSATAASGVLGGTRSAANNEYTQGALAANAMRDNALATGSLVGSADSILARRKAELAGAPTIGAITETGIAANQANAGAMQQRSADMMGRQAMGLAASQGEGGALALQQAMASNGAGVADMAGQSNLDQAQTAAQMRMNAGLAQNQQDVDSANLGLSTRLGAAQTERQNQLGTAGLNATSLEGAAGNRAATDLKIGGAQSELLTSAALADQQARAAGANMSYGAAGMSSGRDMTLQGQGANLALGQATTAGQQASEDVATQMGVLTGQYKVAQDNKVRSTKDQWLHPFGIFGS